MKIRNLFYNSTSALILASLLSITGFSTNAEAFSVNQNESGDKQEKEEGYNASEITVVEVYNPKTEKTEYYFVTFLEGIFLEEQKAKENVKKAFESRKLEQYIDYDKADTSCDGFYYNSVLDDGAYLYSRNLMLSYEESENENSIYMYGTRMLQFFTDGEDFNYTNCYESILSNNEEVCDSFYMTFCSDKKQEEIYYDLDNPETYSIKIHNLETLGYDSNEFISIEELEELKKNGFSGKKTKLR